MQSQQRYFQPIQYTLLLQYGFIIRGYSVDKKKIIVIIIMMMIIMIIINNNSNNDN